MNPACAACFEFQLKLLDGACAEEEYAADTVDKYPVSRFLISDRTRPFSGMQYACVCLSCLLSLPFLRAPFSGFLFLQDQLGPAKGLEDLFCPLMPPCCKVMASPSKLHIAKGRRLSRRRETRCIEKPERHNYLGPPAWRRDRMPKPQHAAAMVKQGAFNGVELRNGMVSLLVLAVLLQ